MDRMTLLWLSFLAGIYAPVGSPCVIALYPAYLSFLAGRDADRKGGTSPFGLGLAVAAGVILSLFLGGIVFALLIRVTGSAFREIVTPAAILLLMALSLLLVLDIDISRFAGTFPLPRAGTSRGAAFLLGLLLGVIVLPCNAAAILALIALAATAAGTIEALAVFLLFGAGMTFPLIIIAGISRLRSRQVMDLLTRHRLLIRRAAGLLMLVISAVYLLLIVVPGLFR